MDIVCPKCNHSHHFDVEVTNYKGFVCSSCHSYFKGEYKNRFDAPDFEFVKQFDFNSTSVLTFLNEKIERFKNPLYTITILIRRNQSNSDLSYEYVLSSDLSEPKYFSHGQDYFCTLLDLESKSVKSIDSSKIKVNNSTYQLDDHSVFEVIYAEGFVFEDLTTSSITSTYQHTYNENLFISEEQFGEHKEYYKGQYISFYLVKDYFQKARDIGDRRNNARLIFFKTALLTVLTCVVLFFLLNFRNLSYQEFKFYETFSTSESQTQFIGQSFVLEGSPKPLIFDGISETNLPEVTFWVKLVNEKTNQVQESKLLKHFHNDVNYASGVTIDFCQVEAGTYHLVFETSRLSTDSLDYKMDYRLKFGDIKYAPLFFLGVIIIILFSMYHKHFFENEEDNFYDNLLEIGYPSLLKRSYFGVSVGLLIVLFTSYLYYSNFVEQCASSTSSSVLEDHTYTGSRHHYYRSYSSDGSGHK